MGATEELFLFFSFSVPLTFYNLYNLQCLRFELLQVAVDPGSTGLCGAFLRPFGALWLSTLGRQALAAPFCALSGHCGCRPWVDSQSAAPFACVSQRRAHRPQVNVRPGCIWRPKCRGNRGKLRSPRRFRLVGASQDRR